MFYLLLYPLHEFHIFFNVFRYITFRTIAATLTALVISLIFGPWLIKRFSSLEISQIIRKDGPLTHLRKAGTPTMGGGLILLSLIIPFILWADVTMGYVWTVILVIAGMSIIGFIDDYKKLRYGNTKGLSIRMKILLQTLVGLCAAILIYVNPAFDTQLWFPFFKEFHPDIGWLYLPFIVFIIVGTSNAVNLTDGLDGLAIGPALITSLSFVLLAYLSGHIKLADYLKIAYVPGGGDLAIFCGAMVGAALGFLWYNAYPAQIFMGDVGSLPLGAALGTIAIMVKQEILLAVIGGIFVIETISVIFQVLFYKTKKRRIFRMAPIHHHFELKGWAEPKIIVRFWIISIILALLAISTLKLR